MDEGGDSQPSVQFLGCRSRFRAFFLQAFPPVEAAGARSKHNQERRAGSSISATSLGSPLHESPLAQRESRAKELGAISSNVYAVYTAIHSRRFPFYPSRVPEFFRH